MPESDVGKRNSETNMRPNEQSIWSWREVVRQRIEITGISQKELCDAAGVRQSQLSQWLKNGKGLSWPKIEAVCHELRLGLASVDDDRGSLSGRVYKLERQVRLLEAWRKANEQANLSDGFSVVDAIHCPGDDYPAVG